MTMLKRTRPKPPRRPDESRIDRWWRARINYPYREVSYRTTENLTMLASMRAFIRLMVLMLVGMCGMVALALTPFQVPSQFTVWPTMVAPILVFAAMPTARHAAYGLLLDGVRKSWAGEWLESGVSLMGLWMMFRSPLTPAEFAAYRDTLDKDTSARQQGGIDPRVVWALHERGVSPSDIEEFATLGADSDAAIVITSHRISLDEWRDLHEAGIVRAAEGKKTNAALVRETASFITWVRTSRASLYPYEFNHATGARAPRSVGDVEETLRAWLTNDRAQGARIRLDRPEQCPHRAAPNDKGCETCGAPANAEHYRSVLHQRVGDRDADRSASSPTVSEWCEATGRLAPFFIAARIDLAEARRMLNSDEPPTEETLEMLAALT